MAIIACEICGNSNGNKNHVAREMMFGMRHAFNYVECANCGCLQLLNPPENIADYYPPEYYAYQRHGWLMTLVRRRWAAYSNGAKSLLGWFITELLFPNNAIASVCRLSLAQDVRFLEIGSGSGKLLEDLAHFGYKRLTGVDPYIARDIHYPSGVSVLKKQYAEVIGEFDVIMLHHSFEHMDKPLATLRTLANLLAVDGTIILRIPIASSYGWKKYGVNWVHLDAPRHFFLHTFQSIEMLAKQVGLKVARIIHEAEEISITGSESYLRDIPLHDRRFRLSNTRKRLLGWFARKCHKKAAEDMNRRGDADMVCFYLKK
jgi:SAM-dependent methyltransferase